MLNFSAALNLTRIAVVRPLALLAAARNDNDPPINGRLLAQTSVDLAGATVTAPAR